MCAQNASGHGVGYQAVRMPDNIVTNIQPCEVIKIYHLTFLKVARFTHQKLEKSFLLQGERAHSLYFFVYYVKKLDFSKTK